MSIDKILNFLFILLGLLFITKFKYLGKIAIEQRKWLNKKLPFPNSEEDFDKSAVMITQGLFLIIGIIFFIAGLAKIFK